MQTKIEITYQPDNHSFILRIAFAIVMLFELAGKLAIVLSSNVPTYVASKPADVLIILKKARAKRK